MTTATTTVGKAGPGPHALEAWAYHWAGNPFVPTETIATFSSDRDVFFFNPEDSSTLGAAVRAVLPATLSASFTHFGDGGLAGVSAVMSVRGNIYTDATLSVRKNFAQRVFSTGRFVVDNDHPGVPNDITDRSLDLEFYVKAGEPVMVTASIAAVAVGLRNPATGKSGGVITNAKNSLDFNPHSYFNILTPGFTVNSASLGIVNNQLVDFLPASDPSPAPEPSTLALLGIGSVCMAFVGVQRRRKTKAA